MGATDDYPDPGNHDLNRRDFLKGGSTAALLAMMGGVRVLADGDEAEDDEKVSFKIKVGLIGLGSWGREILNTLGQLPQADVTAICDTYPSALKRCASAAPGATPTNDFTTLLRNEEIKVIIVATPTHQHKDIAVAALKAGKHVYCEAPLANSVEDARAIAATAKAAPEQVFQPGLQLRADPNRLELVRTFRTGALGKPVMARAQWHKKNSWRASSPNPEREKELNWRLDKATSLGLAGEVGVHALDQALWYFARKPLAISGFGTTTLWDDGREVADTVRFTVDFPDGIALVWDATLANSFEGEYEVYYGSESAVLLRQSDIWLFKEVDARLLGWEIYFPKQQFLNETGIVLKVGASKSVPVESKPGKKAKPPEAPLYSALKTFLRNAWDLGSAREDYIASTGGADGLAEYLAKKRTELRPAPGYLEGFRSAVTAVKANEAVVSGKRVALEPGLFDLA